VRECRKIVNYSKPVIGIVGAGTVGNALRKAFEGRCEMLISDPILGAQSVSLCSLVPLCQVIFIAVPTPSKAGGDADLHVFSEVIAELAAALRLGPDACPVLCIKSAVPPDAISRLQRSYPHIRLVVSPEFLREASPVDDMLAMRSLVLGGNDRDCEVVADLFHEHSNITGEMRTSVLPDAVSAAFLKYQENAFLAMKVSFMNEMFDIFQRSGSQCSWEELQLAFHQDRERMGTTHWQVPGPDGHKGWGGRCLPKDVAALQTYASQLGVDTPLLRAAWTRNLEDRKIKALAVKEYFPTIDRTVEA
tara:strand:+ start:742 stop:1656 length:915 start_codon:yes stop_codon:yes gene_type:complete